MTLYDFLIKRKEIEKDSSNQLLITQFNEFETTFNEKYKLFQWTIQNAHTEWLKTYKIKDIPDILHRGAYATDYCTIDSYANDYNIMNFEDFLKTKTLFETQSQCDTNKSHNYSFFSDENESIENNSNNTLPQKSTVCFFDPNDNSSNNSSNNSLLPTKQLNTLITTNTFW